MFTTLINLVGNIFSGSIKDQRISLSQEQATVLERELLKSQAEIVQLTAKNLQLIAENHKLQEDLASAIATNKGSDTKLPEEAWRVLSILAQAPGRFGVSRLQTESGIEIGKLHFYLDMLEQAGLVDPLPRVSGKRITQVSAIGRAAHYNKNA